MHPLGSQYRVFLTDGSSLYSPNRRSLRDLGLVREDVAAIHQGCVTIFCDQPVWWHAAKFTDAEIDEVCEHVMVAS